MLGTWAANLLGLKGRKADAYATSVVKVELTGPSDDYVVDKLRSDFRDGKVAVSDAELDAKLAHLAEKARAQIMSGAGGQRPLSA